MSDQLLAILIFAALGLISFFYKVMVAVQKEKKRIAKQNIVPAVQQQPIITSIDFPEVVRSAEVDDDHHSENEYNLTEVSSIVCQDKLGQQLKFDRIHELVGDIKYREVTFSVSDMASKAVQMAMPAGQQLYTLASIAQMAPHGLFTSTVDPVLLSHFLKDGTYTTMIHGTNGVVAHAGFKQIPGLNGFNPVAIVTIAFQAMAILSGNHYMHLINQRLNSIEDSIQEIMEYNTDHDLGVLSYAQRRLIEITSHSSVTDNDMEDIRDIKRDVGKLYDQYRIMYTQQKERIRAYKAEKGSIDKRMNGFYSGVRGFITTAKVCAMSYQIYLQAILTEIGVSMKRDVQKAELDNMISDALNICNMCFEDPNVHYRWIQTKAQKILNEKTAAEKLIGINEKKKEKWLEPAIKSSDNLSTYMSEVIDTETSENLLYSLKERKQMILIPGEGDSQPRIFIPVTA